MPWPGFEPGRIAPLPPQDSVSTNSTTRAQKAVTSCEDGTYRGPEWGSRSVTKAIIWPESTGFLFIPYQPCEHSLGGMYWR